MSSVSIIIPTYNRCNSLQLCLESLRGQTCKDFEVIVVDVGSTDGTKELVQKFSDMQIRYILSQRSDLTAKKNLGWKLAQSDIVAFIDDDVVLNSMWLSELLNTFLWSDKVGGVTGPTLVQEDRLKNRDLFYFLGKFKEKDIVWRTIGKIYEIIILEGRPLDVGRIFRSGAFSPGSNYSSCLNIKDHIEVDYLEACNMSFRRNLVEKVSGFDESYSGTSEWSEPDLSFKISNLGYSLIFNPKVIVEHNVSRSGVFASRTYAYERTMNFIHFYLSAVKLNTFDKAMRFNLNLFFINAYWFYKFLLTKNTDWLTGLSGTLKGLLNAFKRIQ
jgi:glycosyltransferase involved in cell wall biosynthesis